MKKVLITLLIALLFAICSCSQYMTGMTGTTSFNISAQTKAISGELLAYDASSITWKLTAQKTDDGEKFGACENQIINPNSYTGEFSIGDWNFTVDGYSGSNKIYTGAKDATISLGDNNISITINGTGTIGKIRFSAFQVNSNEKEVVIKIDDDVSGAKVYTYLDSATSSQAFDYEKELTTGLHSVTLELRDSGSQVTRVISFKANIYAGIISEIGVENTNTVFDIVITIPSNPVIG